MKITELFNADELKEKNDGNFQTVCPDCGLQGGRTEGLILYPETNTWFCHSSNKHGGILELYAIKKKIIKCNDCNDTGEKKTVLVGDLLTNTLDELKEEYGEEICDEILEHLGFKKRIELPNNGKLISTFADELAKKFKKEQIFFYRSETKDIVEISKIKLPNGNLEYNGFLQVSGNRFITLVERYFKPWQKIYTKNGIINVDKSMISSIASIVMESDNFRNEMPLIKRIFTFQLPIIHEGKLTFPKEGYDIRFGSWLSYHAPKISNPDMTIEEAKGVLSYIFNEFCFQTNQDYTNAIAGILSPFLRGLYPAFNTRVPVIIYLANRERAGKDYLAGITGILYEGCALEEPPISNSDEMRKKILSALISGRKRLHFANNKGHLDNSVFEGIITAKKYSDRLLGKNETPTFDNELEFSLSGNLGMTMTPDLINRSIFIRLFLDIEDANSRKFNNPNLHLWIYNNRDNILSALYSLVKNWIDNSCPNGKMNFASYPEWANVCGGIMECAGFDNPCMRNEEISNIGIDTETDDMKQLFEICYEKMPEQWIKKVNIKNILIESDDVFSYVDWNNKSDQTKFGIKIDRFTGRILSGIRMVSKEPNCRKSRMEFKFTKEINVGNPGDFGNTKTSVVSPIYNTYNTIASPTNPFWLPILPGLPKPKKIKPISDRQVQYWEAEECKGIVTTCTKQEVLDWIKANPGSTFEQMYEKFRFGSPKFLIELIRSKEVRKENDKIYPEGEING